MPEKLWYSVEVKIEIKIFARSIANINYCYKHAFVSFGTNVSIPTRLSIEKLKFKTVYLHLLQPQFLSQLVDQLGLATKGLNLIKMTIASFEAKAAHEYLLLNKKQIKCWFAIKKVLAHHQFQSWSRKVFNYLSLMGDIVILHKLGN